MSPSDRACALIQPGEQDRAAIVDLPPPAPAAALALARFLIETFARRALADLGVLATDDPGVGPGIAHGVETLSPDRSSSGARCGAMAAGG